jgi:glycosyltransferase involved in cell wall biosynthesis
MRVALVHDWLTGMRGGEKALEVLCEIYPDAELFTLLAVPDAVSAPIARLRTHTSFVQHLPFARRVYRHMLPLFPAAVETFDLDGFDLVISTSHCAAKSVIVPGRARHLCYCFTPMRYAWDQFDQYFGPERVGPLQAAAARLVMRRMARWDRATAGRVGRYVAISRYVASRIRRYYNRESVVVYPPVDTRFYVPGGARGSYFLIVSALVPYKRIDVAVEAARRANVPLRIVGAGPERARLAALGGGSVEFLGTRTDDEIRELYQGCCAVVLPGEEDFGIVPVEAQACGRPVVALGRGGALETVDPAITGELAGCDDPEAIATAMRRCRDRDYDSALIRAHAERFGRERFRAELTAAIDDVLERPAGQQW